MNPIVSTLIKGMLYYILKAKQGGKYLNRKQVVDRKTGKMRYQYKYKPMQQRAAHEVTRNKFEKVTKLSGDEHKTQIEHALQNGIHVSLHVLRDYPDLAVKYHQQARLAKADKIRAKVKTHKEKERMEREVRLNTPEGLKNNPIKLEAERMMREDGLIKDVPVSDNREVENNFETMPESVYEKALKTKDSKDINNWLKSLAESLGYNEEARKKALTSKYRIKQWGEMNDDQLKADRTKFLNEQVAKNKVNDIHDLQQIIDSGVTPEKTFTHTYPYSEQVKQQIIDGFKKINGKEYITENSHRVYIPESFTEKALGLKDVNGKKYLLGNVIDNNTYNIYKTGIKAAKLNFDLIDGMFKYQEHQDKPGSEYKNGMPEGVDVEMLISEINKNTGLNFDKTKAFWKKGSQPDNFDTMPESKPEPAKNTDLKANFESWKEERKTAAPAFKLEQEDITSKEKNTRFNDAQGGLFGKKPVTHESYAKKDFKPSLALEGNETITSLVTAVKSALMREGLDSKAREFVDNAFKEKDLDSLKKMASEYVDMKESSQVSIQKPDDRGSEEKKPMNEIKGKEIAPKGKEKSRERFYENNGYYVDVIDSGYNRPDIMVGVEGKREIAIPQTMAGFTVKDINLPEYKLERDSLKKQGVDPNNYIGVGGSIVRKEAKEAIEQAAKRFKEIKLQDPYERKKVERERLESLKFPSGKIEEIEDSLENEVQGFNKFMESEEDYSKLKSSKYTNADLEAEYAKYPKFVAHRRLKSQAYKTIEPDELDAIYAKMAELEKSYSKGSEDKKMNDEKKTELLEIGDSIVSGNNQQFVNTFTRSENQKNKDLFTGRIDKFLGKISNEISTENASPKQVSYAESIKYDVISYIRTTIKNKLVSSKSKEEYSKGLEGLAKLDTFLNSKLDAKWWIDRKDMGFKNIKELQKKFPNTLGNF